MENIWDFGVKWNLKNMSIFATLIILPNLLGLVNITTPLGFKIHTFQVAIFMAAALFGPKGGLLSGLIGSAYSGIIMSNPYILVGNAILGFSVGYFAQRTSLPKAVLLGFAFQLPWLILTDLFLIGMPLSVLVMLIASLAVSNTIWALVAKRIAVR